MKENKTENINNLQTELLLINEFFKASERFLD